MEKYVIWLGAALWIAQIVCFLIPIQKKSKSIINVAVGAFSSVGNVLIAVYYNKLPGKGPMPGLTYTSQTFLAFGLVIFTVLLFVLSVILAVIQKRREGK